MSGHEITLKNDAVRAAVRVRADGGASLAYVLPADEDEKPSCSSHFEDSSLPLVELRLSGEGNVTNKSSKALVGSYVGSRLVYKTHQEKADGATKTLDVELHDEKTKVTVTSHLTIFDGQPFLRSSVTVNNGSDVAVVVNQMPSIVVGGMTRSPEWWNDYEVSYANNTWFREAQWMTHSLPSVGIDDYGIYGLPEKQSASLSTFALSNHSSFSTQRHLPMGVLKKRDQSETWLWQIENNGSWKWEIGDFYDNVYMAASGPNSDDHEWRQRLAPGASFTSVPVSLCHVYADQCTALGLLNQYRRVIRRPHADHKHLPIIFNDYMNCLMGDPTEDKILALVGPVAKSGAEFFVIDCGWYADDGNWWDDVGLWEPSKKRFPSGFQNLLSKIREAGLRPGLWIEPEVVGVRSVVAKQLPNEAFFQRDGQRVVEKNRYQLDYRHPAVVERMNAVMKRCIEEYGAGYFKFDYNIEVTQGTDINCSSPGVGQLEHQRAYLDWVSSLFDRYPDLVIENCSSGAQRMDYAMLSVHTLQSTSDQQWPHHYAAIAAGVPTAVTPEQSATWAYPQGDWSDEKNAMTVVNSLLGRIHLSGRLDTMSSSQLKLVYDGMKVYQDIRKHIPTSTPFWPLGLPAWHDDWLALGLKATPDTGLCYVSVWRRSGSSKCTIPVTPLSGRKGIKVDVLYPTQLPSDVSWDEVNSAVQITLPEEMCARLVRIQVS